MNKDRDRELFKLQWKENQPLIFTVVLGISILVFIAFVKYPVGESYRIEGVLESAGATHGGTAIGSGLVFHCLLENGEKVIVYPAKGVSPRLGERVVLVAQNRFLGGVEYSFYGYVSK